MKYCVGILPDFIHRGFILMHDYSGAIMELISS